jgi:hypothetical protein
MVSIIGVPGCVCSKHADSLYLLDNSELKLVMRQLKLHINCPKNTEFEHMLLLRIRMYADYAYVHYKEQHNYVYARCTYKCACS